jgi:hypothetical protein
MAAELLFKYTGGAANADPDLSLGGTGSSVTLLTVALNNLFDNVYPDDIAVADHVSYRAIDILNDGANNALHVGFFFTDTTNTESVLAAGFDSVGTQTIANDTTAPIGITFTEPTQASQLSLANMAAAGTHRIWIRRTVDQGAANLNDDLGYLHVWYS